MLYYTTYAKLYQALEYLGYNSTTHALAPACLSRTLLTIYLHSFQILWLSQVRAWLVEVDLVQINLARSAVCPAKTAEKLSSRYVPLAKKYWVIIDDHLYDSQVFASYTWSQWMPSLRRKEPRLQRTHSDSAKTTEKRIPESRSEVAGAWGCFIQPAESSGGSAVLASSILTYSGCWCTQHGASPLSRCWISPWSRGHHDQALGSQSARTPRE